VWSKILFRGSSIQTTGSFVLNIDSNNNSVTAYFAVAKDGVDNEGTELFRVQENGNVGIGTDSPQVRLHIEKDDPGASLTIGTYYTAWLVNNNTTDGNLVGILLLGKDTDGNRVGVGGVTAVIKDHTPGSVDYYNQSSFLLLNLYCHSPLIQQK